MGDSGRLELSDEPRARSLGWLELFFDLVVVVSMALMAERLHEHSDWSGVAIFALTYVAIWLTWSSYVLYANVADEGTHTGVLVRGMALIALMAASIVQIDERANVFAIAFVLCRISTSRASLRTGRLLASWPLLQLGGTTVPWIVSLWIETPAKFVIWAVALAIDLVASIVRARSDEGSESMVAELNARMRREQERGRESRRDGRQGELGAGLVTTGVRVDHLDERLGVFVIIVLGEAVTQLVKPAAQLETSGALIAVGFIGFFLLLGLWRLNFSYGFAGAPNQQLASLPVRIGLPVHLVTTGAIVALAAALGAFITHVHEPPEDAWGWIGCGSLALYFGAITVGAVAARAPRTWILGWGVPSTLFPLALGVLAPHIGVAWLTLLLVVPVSWQVAYGTIRPEPAAVSGGRA